MNNRITELRDIKRLKKIKRVVANGLLRNNENPSDMIVFSLKVLKENENYYKANVKMLIKKEVDDDVIKF